MQGGLSVHHIAVVVRDLARVTQFYAEVLDLPVMRRWEDAAGAPRSVWLTLGGGAFLAVERAGAEEGSTGKADDAPGWHCIALAIPREAREAWRGRLAAAGFPVERESRFTLYTRDPERNLIALSHYPEPADPGG